jgi:hypothetical protein
MIFLFFGTIFFFEPSFDPNFFMDPLPCKAARGLLSGMISFWGPSTKYAFNLLDNPLVGTWR